MKKRLIVLICVISIILPLNTAFVKAENQSDAAFDTANAFLSGINIMNVEEENKEKGISRGKFAQLLTLLMGISVNESEEESSGNKFTGNVFEQEEDDTWKWLGDSDLPESGNESIITENGTCFYDVSSDYEYWQYIKLLASYGIFTGNEGYFYPERMITTDEAVKLMVLLLNADFMTEGKYPEGYLRVAAQEGILKNLINFDSNMRLTERNAAVLFYNTLHTEVYVREYTNAAEYTVRKKEDYYVMTKAFDMHYVKAVINSDGITSIGEEKAMEGYISAGGEYYALNGKSSKDLIGSSVILYYYEDSSGDRSVAYIEKNKSRNSELLIDAEDIVGFTGGVLSYYDGSRIKTISLRNDTAVIYNGVLTENYTAECFELEEGNIKLTDNDGDARYDVISITKIKTVIAGTIDTENEIIYDKYDNALSIDADSAYTKIYDAAGEETEIKNISSGNVLSVTETLPEQDEKRTLITVSSRSISGSYTSIDMQSGEIQINGKIYKMSYRMEQPAAMGEYRFYLDAGGKVVWFDRENAFRYGYLIKIYPTEDQLSYQLKMFETDGEFRYYELSERMKLNYKSMKDEAVYQALKNTKGELVQFNAAEDKITEILRCGADETRFVKGYDNSDGIDATYRTISGLMSGFFAGKPIAYTDADTVIMNVPRDDVNNADYYYLKKGTHDDKLRINQAYYSGKDAAVADVLISYSESENASAKVPAVSKVFAVSASRETRFDSGDIGYEVDGYRDGKLITYSCLDEEICKGLADLKPGDLAVFELNSLGNIKCFVKVFDAASKTMVAGVHMLYNEKDTEFEQNIQQRSADKNTYVAHYRSIHGMIYGKYDNEGYYDVAPFIYEDGENTGRADTENLWTLKFPAANVLIYDESARGSKLRQGGFSDLIDYTSSGEGTEIVVYLFWGNVSQIVIYR